LRKEQEEVDCFPLKGWILNESSVRIRVHNNQEKDVHGNSF